MAAQRGMSCITDKLNAAHLSVYTGHSGTRITTSHLLAFRAKKGRGRAGCRAEIRPSGRVLKMIHQVPPHIEKFNQGTSKGTVHAWPFKRNEYFRTLLAQHNTN